MPEIRRRGDSTIPSLVAPKTLSGDLSGERHWIDFVARSYPAPRERGLRASTAAHSLRIVVAMQWPKPPKAR
jgi:hypothetical protein